MTSCPSFLAASTVLSQSTFQASACAATASRRSTTNRMATAQKKYVTDFIALVLSRFRLPIAPLPQHSITLILKPVSTFHTFFYAPLQENSRSWRIDPSNDRAGTH